MSDRSANTYGQSGSSGSGSSGGSDTSRSTQEPSPTDYIPSPLPYTPPPDSPTGIVPISLPGITDQPVAPAPTPTPAPVDQSTLPRGGDGISDDAKQTGGGIGDTKPTFDGKEIVSTTDKGFIKLKDSDGNISYKSPDGKTEKTQEDLRNDWMKGDYRTTWEKIKDGVNSLFTPGNVAGGVGMATLGPVGGAIAKAAIDKLGGAAPTQEQVEAIKGEIFDKDPDSAAALMGYGESTYTPPSGSTPTVRPTESNAPSATGQTHAGETGGSTLATLGSAVNSTVPQAATTPAPAVVSPADQAKIDLAAKDKAEQERYQGMLKSMGVSTPSAWVSPTPISSAGTNAAGQAVVQQANDISMLSQKAGQNETSQLAALKALPTLTADNRDAWKQYYDPAATQATAAQATAAQAQGVTVAPASQITGNYTADTTQMQGYDPTIATSDQRAQSVAMLDQLMKRASGQLPSVAEMSYKANLDKLIASQSAATGGLRGQDQALGIRNVQDQAILQGQQAVQQTAILRQQEQQAAEQAATAQANAITAEDNRVAIQSKVNELQRDQNVLSADLQNAKNTLDKDQFNADAINKVNQLQAQLTSTTQNLNAQLANATAMQNASDQTKVALQNAMNQLSQQQYAGSQAQSALLAQMTQGRSDLTTSANIQNQAATTQMEAGKDILTSMGALAGQQSTEGISTANNAALSDVRKAQATSLLVGASTDQQKMDMARQRADDLKKAGNYAAAADILAKIDKGDIMGAALEAYASYT